METNNAKSFALQLGALITLFVSVGSLISLLFGVITIVIPDALGGWYEVTGAKDSIRWGIALLVVFFPAYIVLTRVVNKGRRGTGTPYLGVTKWLIYLALVVGGITILGDFVAIIVSFLNGDLTTRFLLKALTVLVVVGAPTLYYFYDTRGYWLKHEAKSKQYGGIVAVLVFASIVVGYLHIESPQEVRAQRADDTQITDLTSIQYIIESEYNLTGALPVSLDVVSERMTIPTAPEGRGAYEYNKTGDRTFELCATFSNPSRPDEFSTPWPSEVGIKNPNDWSHKEGRTCFPRIMNEPNAGTVPVKPVM